MDSITTIRMAAGVIAVVVLGIIISRRKRLSSGKRMTSKR